MSIDEDIKFTILEQPRSLYSKNFLRRRLTIYRLEPFSYPFEEFIGLFRENTEIIQ